MSTDGLVIEENEELRELLVRCLGVFEGQPNTAVTQQDIAKEIKRALYGEFK